MSRGRTPNYIISEAHSYHVGSTDTRTLEAGTFVRPIELPYVPKHVTENPQNRCFNKETDIYCYCRFGIIPIPRKIVRESV